MKQKDFHMRHAKLAEIPLIRLEVRAIGQNVTNAKSHRQGGGVAAKANSNKSKVLDQLCKLNPHDDYLTAFEISKLSGVKLYSVSSILRRLISSKNAMRKSNVGPRGGYGYRMKTAEEAVIDAMAQKIWEDLDKKFLEDMLKSLPKSSDGWSI